VKTLLERVKMQCALVEKCPPATLGIVVSEW
jgi:hypothetical protein